MNISRQTYSAHFPKQKFAARQNGVALIMVLTVLFALTLLGLASTDSSNLQALMVRNNQFRLEVFNAGLSEIDDQLSYYSTEKGTVPLFYAIRLDETFGVASTTTGSRALKATSSEAAQPTDVGGVIGLDPGFQEITSNPLFDKELVLTREGQCPLYNNTVGGVKKCSLMELEMNTGYKGTNISSGQNQQFAFSSF
ncbi:hypothetical protein NBRC116583_27890 [Arenicella sp. 4NH20-0111]|uniref:pilus assembly PilX family protein n=1 Tax=Arenicella sp. 4NH20-0111 TaxID=3127648 RepID=UPI003106D4C6